MTDLDQPSAIIRPYRLDDYEAVGRVCVLTGDSGKDASGKFFSDELLPALYAYPYVLFAPEMARVVELDGEVVGYIVGVPNVREFSTWWKREWTPRFQEMFSQEQTWNEAEKSLIRKGLDPDAEYLAPFREEFPADFHIDMLPAAQGRGLGRKLITGYRQRLARLGVDKLAIGVGAANESAVGFYKHLGLKILSEHRNEEGEPTGYSMWISTS